MADIHAHDHESRMSDDWRAALRPDKADSKLLDDVVVKDVPMFRFEMMDDRSAWMCCYLDDVERIDFWITVRRGRLEVVCTDAPDTITYERES